jgi:probable rRNA maturation factor
MATADRRRSGSPGRLNVVVTCPDSTRIACRALATWLRKAAPPRARGDVTVALISDTRMRTLNRTFRGKDYATDVLSFSVDTETFLGDIAIATGVAQRQADEAGHSLDTELRVLALHGLLHLLGFDHERDDGQMRRAEARLRKAAGLREGLIERGPSTNSSRQLGTSPSSGLIRRGPSVRRSPMLRASSSTTLRASRLKGRTPKR